CIESGVRGACKRLIFGAPMSALQGLRRPWLLWAAVVALPIVALSCGLSLPATGAFVVALAIVATVAWRAGETRSAAFRSLLDTLEEGVLMMDRKGNLAASNPSAARILGMDPARILDVNQSDADWMLIGTDGEPLPEEDRPMRETARTGEPRL